MTTRLVDIVNFNNGKIVKDDFINFSSSIENQENILTEDMFQVHYFNGFYIIDIGWYGHSNCFIIYLIKDNDWDNPLVEKKCIEKEDIINGVKEVINLLNKIIN